MKLAEIETTVRQNQLDVMGALHPSGEEAPDGARTIVLLGPLEPGFWPSFCATPEYNDGHADPLDRWSRRVIGMLADQLGAMPLFPFGGPPYWPFVRWALASGRAQVSPVGLLVHDRAGLMVSYRGALAFTSKINVPPAPPSPCITCQDQPCRTACPVGALTPDRYDMKACKADLDRPGNDCMATGCAARRACPVSRAHGRLEAQSAFHMSAFK
ncbi:ferredoxin [Roseovarius sp. SYSU LYC5161]|uniref:ferredoxin n=1 Tax=Roseovarius halophilus (ex Wu et al. 2025) TaxID=3376060 RepID=UPI002871FCE9|nr:ferredoxin [Roseovarius sp.]